MSIILNEYDWAERMIENHELGDKPYETLSRVSRYYYENHYSKRNIRKLLDSFLLQCDQNVKLVKWSDLLDKLAGDADSRPLVKLDVVPVTQRELDTIAEISGKQERRLAFTLLCVSKFRDLVSSAGNHWVSTPDTEIMKMANVHTSIKRQSAMFGDLRERGLIKFARRVDNLNVQVLFQDNDPKAEPVMLVRDFRNLGYQYLKQMGDDTYFECVNCGITTKSAGRTKSDGRGRPPKYCSSCSAEIRIRQNVNSVMKHRGGYLS